MIGNDLPGPALLSDRRGDGINLFHRHACPAIDSLERSGGLLGKIGAIFGLPGAGFDTDNRTLRLALNRTDHLTDFTGRFGRAFGEFAHFVSDDGKSTPLLAGTRGFNGRIECQQIGLIGNFANGLNDATDRL